MPKYLFIFLLFAHFQLLSQEKYNEYPQGYFRSPLDIPLFLSGNFGELRSNHFHAGLDIKTQGVQGKKVYAVADGYISRIKVSPYGYGKAIYVNHPNGYTSVYGHLQKYSDKIEEVVQKDQYQRERYDIQLFPAPFSIPVKKGDIIAYSGNSGGSGGPHLHFEIRKTDSEHPYNPLLFGFGIEDNIPPQILKIAIYPMNENSYINGSNRMKIVDVQGVGGTYSLASNYPILLQGDFGFGIMAVDRMNGTHNKYGLHNLQLYYENELIYEQEIEEFAFNEGRYINAHIDYALYARRKSRFQKSFVSPGNKLRIYKNLKNNGIVHISDSSKHEVKYLLTDLYGNQSKVVFTIEGQAIEPVQNAATLQSGQVIFMDYNRSHTFIKDEVLVRIPKGLLYEDIYFEYRKEPATDKTISPIYWLHNHYTPLHSHMNVSIKMENLEPALKPYALIVSSIDGKSWYAEGGSWQGDNLAVRTRSFGGYAVAIDSVPPSIRPINISNGSNLAGKWSMQFKIKDDLSGIDHYRAEVDGKWILMEYDAKNDLLTHFFDGKITAGKHELVLKVTDGRGNKKEYKADFYR